MFIYRYQWQARHKSYLFDSGQNWAMNDAHLCAQLVTEDKYIFAKKLIGDQMAYMLHHSRQSYFF